MSQIIIAKNLTVGDLPLVTLGSPDAKIPGSGQVTLTDFNFVWEIQEDLQLKSYINADQVIINDGTSDLSKAESLNIVTPPASTTDPLFASTTDTGGGSGNAGRFLILDGSGKADGRNIELDGTNQDSHIANANIHANHTTININTSEGIQGGGNISATRNLKLDINGLTLDATPDSSSDFVATYDNSTGLHKKVLINNLLTSGANLSAVCARRTTTFAIPQSPTWGNVTFDVTDIENNVAVVEHDNTNTDRIILKETGLYQVSYSLLMASPLIADQINLRVIKNGVTVIPQLSRMSEDDNENRSIFHGMPIEATAGDYIVLQVQRGNSVPFNLLGDTMLSVVRLRGSKGDTGPVGSGSNIIVQEEGTSIPNTPHSQINFVGSSVTATDGGSGKATITINGGIFGQGFQHQEKTTTQTTTSNSFQNYTTLTTPALNAGTYRIGWMYVWRLSSTSQDFNARLQVDNIINLINPGDSGNAQHAQEPKDAASNQRQVTAGFRYVSLSSGVHFVDLDFKSSIAGITAYMFHGVIDIWRVA